MLAVVTAELAHLGVDLVPFGLGVEDQATLEDVAVDHQTVVQHAVQLLAQLGREADAPFGVDPTVVFSEEVEHGVLGGLPIQK